jgi:hypothetical protein
MTLFLIGCAGDNSGESKTKHLILPDVIKYTPTQQIQLADEIEYLMKTKTNKPACMLFAKDYDVMQQQTRAAYEVLTGRPGN